MLLSMVKGWTGKDNDQKVSHGEGLAFLLTAAESGQSSDQFHETIRDTLYVPVVSCRTAHGSVITWTFTYSICLTRF